MKDINVLRHSLAHIMAEAVNEMYPDVKFAIGPAIDNGFYYDFDIEQSILPENLSKIEDRMRELIKRDVDFTQCDMAKEDALKYFADQPYKVELIKGIEDTKVSTYTSGEFTDLCKGPHVDNSRELRNCSFKLMSVAGAYWRGDSKNKMLQRIYAICFATKEEMKQYLADLEEAKLRDHRKIGKDLEIFMFNDLVGRGLPMWLPKGFILRRALCDYIMDKEIALGYEHVMTPSLGNVNLYKTSGHWDHYKDDMFPAMDMEDESYVLRPMNCPHHMVMFKNFQHSYRDLPLRIAELANDFRFEIGGTLCGIERTRAFTQNDSHIFCRPDQIKDEVDGVIKLILDVYKDFGFKNYKFRLSLRDKNNVEKYFGNDELWEKSESALREILKATGAEYYEAEGEAAFYGPKIDVQVRSAIGHDITLSTVQLDYQLPERFELEYVNENNEKERPVVIHRAILGTFDRFIAFVLEETKGLLPVWLSPVQTKIIPVSENNNEYARMIENKLKNAGLRVETNLANESMGKKIRSAVLSKIPYMLILGEKEQNENTVSIKIRGGKQVNDIQVDKFIEVITSLNKNKTLDLQEEF